jgi:hypothetical protein
LGFKGENRKLGVVNESQYAQLKFKTSQSKVYVSPRCSYYFHKVESKWFWEKGWQLKLRSCEMNCCHAKVKSKISRRRLLNEVWVKWKGEMEVYLPSHLHANEISISNCLSFAHRLDMVVEYNENCVWINVVDRISSPNLIWLLWLVIDLRLESLNLLVSWSIL